MSHHIPVVEVVVECVGWCGCWERGGGMCRLLERMLGELPSAGGTGVQGSGVENGGCCHSMKFFFSLEVELAME